MVAVETLSHSHGKLTGGAFVEPDGEVESLALGPKRVIVGVVPVAALDGVGAEEYALEAEVLGNAPGLCNGGVYILGRDHARTEHPPGVALAELGEPVVVGTGYGSCQLIIVVDLGVGEEAHGREKQGQIYPLGVHGLDLGVGTPAPVLEGQELVKPAVALRQIYVHFPFVGEVVLVAGDDSAVVLEAEVHEVLFRADGGEVPELGGDVGLPEVGGLHDVHVAVDDLKTVLSHCGALLRAGVFCKPVSPSRASAHLRPIEISLRNC